MTKNYWLSKLSADKVKKKCLKSTCTVRKLIMAWKTAYLHINFNSMDDCSIQQHTPIYCLNVCTWSIGPKPWISKPNYSKLLMCSDIEGNSWVCKLYWLIWVNSFLLLNIQMYIFCMFSFFWWKISSILKCLKLDQFMYKAQIKHLAPQYMY